MAKSKIKVEFESDSKKAQKSISELEKQLQSLQASFKSAEVGTAEFKKLGDEIIKTKFQIDNASKAASLSGERMMALGARAAAVGASLSAMIDHYKAVIQKSREFEKAQMKHFNPTLVQLEYRFWREGLRFGIISIPHWCN